MYEDEEIVPTTCDSRPGAIYTRYRDYRWQADLTGVRQITRAEYEATKEHNDGSRQQAAAHLSLMRVRDAIRRAKDVTMLTDDRTEDEEKRFDRERMRRLRSERDGLE